jgi:geranylgeranyl diphosphate synthase type II
MPTSHVKHGENVAILAGDGLFAEAMRLFCERQQGEPALVVAALGELVGATGVGGMVGGQYVDVTADELEPEALREMHSLKTGRLIGASVGVVLLLDDVSEDAAAPYRRFAAELGMLFQIVDDILDVTGSDEELGKPSGSDERHGKLTYVSAFGLERAQELASETHRRAREALAEARTETDDLVRITDFIHTRQT